MATDSGESSRDATQTRSERLVQSAQERTKYGFYVVLAGLGLIGLLYIVTIIIFSIFTPANVVQNTVAALGAVTGVIGSMVAGYFGTQLGSAGREREEAVREEGREAAHEEVNGEANGSGSGET